MFPTDPDEFDADDRISFSKVSNTFILETDDGREFQWDQALKRWTEDVDDDEIARQQQAYAVAGVDESEPAMNPRNKRRRRRDDPAEDGRSSPASKRARKPGQTEGPPKERKNTAVYVTNLPLSATADEVRQVFSRCGMIAEEIDSGRPRIKMYEDAATGRFKGDALVVYFRPESVQLALQMLDDTDFRLGEDMPAGRMSVVEADRSYKRQNNDGGAKAENGGETNGGGSNDNNNNNNGNANNGSSTTTDAATTDAAAAAKARQAQSRDKRKIIERTQKLNARLADWSSDDEWYEGAPRQGRAGADAGKASRWDKIVILKHMFTQAELDDDPAALLDIKADIRDECARLGDVTNVVLYDAEPDGVAAVRFREPAAARACVDLMHGRWFAGTQVQAYVSTGERFRKTGRGGGNDDPELDGPDWADGDAAVGAGVGVTTASADADLARADKFGAWLEATDAEAQVEREDENGPAGQQPGTTAAAVATKATKVTGNAARG